MSGKGQPIYALLLLGFAVGCATLTGHLLSILWLGDWKYRELIAPICTSAIAVVASSAGAAVFYKGGGKLRAIAGHTAVIVAGCCIAAMGLFFGILANCNLSCGTRIEAETKSPTGQWRAVRFSRNCVSVARYCRPILHVSIVSEGQSPGGNTGNAFSVDTFDGVDLVWKSDWLVLIRYPAGSQVLRHEDLVVILRI